VKNRYLLEGYAQGITVGKRMFALDLPHHGFFNFGNPPDIFKRTNITGPKARFLIKIAVKFGVVIGPLKYPFEFFQLEIPESVPGKCFQNGIPVFLVCNHKIFFIIDLLNSLLLPKDSENTSRNQKNVKGADKVVRKQTL
jgi:hypothetical protein